MHSRNRLETFRKKDMQENYSLLDKQSAQHYPVEKMKYPDFRFDVRIGNPLLTSVLIINPEHTPPCHSNVTIALSKA